MQKTPYWILLDNELDDDILFLFLGLFFKLFLVHLSLTWLNALSSTYADKGRKRESIIQKKVMLKTEIMPHMLNSKRNAVVYEVFIGIHLELPK